MRNESLKTLGWATALLLGPTVAGQTITGFSPATVAAGSPQFTLTVSGTALGAVNRLSWTDPGINNSPVFLPINSGGTATQFDVVIPAARVATPGNAIVSACFVSGSLPTCGPSTTFPIGIQLTSLTPSSALAGSGQPFTTNVGALGGLGSGGSYFWNGTTPLTPVASPSATSAAVQIPASLVNTAGTGTITVTINGQTSNGLVFTVLNPVTTSLAPNSALAGSPSFNLVINGSNFGTSASGTPQVRWTVGSTTTTLTPAAGNSSTSMTVTIPASLLASPGTASVAVQNFPSSAGPISNAQTFTISAGPAITSLSPNPTPAGALRALNVFGTGFSNTDTILIGAPGCVVQSCTQPLSTTFNSPTNLSGSLLGSLIPQQGIYNIFVLTGQNILSQSSPLMVGLTILTLNPSSAQQNASPLPTMAVTTSGGFTPSSVISFNSQPVTTVFDSPTQVHTTLTAAQLSTAGGFPVTVQTPTFAPSNALTFTVSAANPTLSSVTPNVATAGDGNTPVTITGTGFQPDSQGRTGSRVLFTPPGNATPVQLTPSAVTATSLAVTIPQAQLAVAGSASIAVTNVTDGTTSGSLPFTIRPRPSLSSLSPNPTPAATAATLTVLGANFTNGDTIVIAPNGCVSSCQTQALTTTFNSAANLSGALPGSLIPTPGTYNVYVQNSLGALSQALPLTVSLAITSVSPAIVTQNVSPAPSLVVTSPGGFLPGAVILFNNQSLTTVFDSSTQVHAALSATQVAVAGVFPVAVRNPDLTTSNSLTFTVQPRGQITAVTPASVFAGAAATTLQVTGSNFAASDVVRLGSNVLATTFINSTTLSALAPAVLLTNATTYSVTVLSSRGDSSNSLTFTVALQITSLSPPFVTAGGPAFNLTATLTGGATSNTRLFYAGTSLTTVSFTSTSITSTVPASLITAVATPPVFATDSEIQSNTVTHLVLGSLSLTVLSPSSVLAGTSGLQLNMSGTGFDRGTFATVSGVAVPTTFISATSLTAQIPASLLVTPQNAPVMVTDSQQRTSNALTLAILSPLTLTSVSPVFAEAGSPQITITATGTGFNATTFLTWGSASASANLTTTFVSGTRVTAIAPAALLTTVGTAAIGAQDTQEHVAPSSVAFAIVTPLTLTNLNPSSAVTGTTVNLVLTGTGFTPSLPGVGTAVLPQVLFGDTSIPVTSVNSTQISASIPATLNYSAGTTPVSVRLADGRLSNALPFTATSNPVLTSISPSAVDLRAGGLTLTADGLFFQTGAVIVLNGSVLATTFVSSTRLTAPLPQFASQGSATVAVVNPNGLASNTLALAIGGAKPPTQPTLSAISPATVAAGSPGFTLTASGSGFQSGAVINFGGTGLVTTFVSSGTLTGVVPASLLTQPATLPVFVTNPDGTSTNSLPFVISGKPVITALNPPSISAGAPGFALGVIGFGFKAGAAVSFGGVGLATSFLSSGQLAASVPASLVKTPGQVPVIVTNPDGVASDPAIFVVNPFSLTSISPSSANAGGSTFSMTLTGVGFLNGASASFNGSGVSTTFVNSTTLSASIPAAALVIPGAVPVTVTNPDGAVGGPVVFTIRGITLTSISPTTIPANSKATPLAATGTGFVQGASIVFNGTPIATTFGSATSVSGTIPPELLTQTGTFTVTVVNPNGDGSNALNLTVGPPLPPPVITSLSKTTATAGSAAFTMTVAGSGFVQGSIVVFGGTNSATTFVNATQLTAVVTAAQLSQGGLFTVRVTNPDGQQSNAVNFTIITPLSITSLSPSALSAAAGGSTLVIAGAGIVSGATVQFGSSSLTPDATSPTQVSVTIPAALLSQAGQVTITVTNPDGTVSNGLPVTIVALPTISVGATITPAGTNQVTLSLDTAAPADLVGTLVLSFAANALNTPANYVDPAVQFASGGTSISFAIAKGAKSATLPGNGVFSPGTVAGTLTLTLTRLIAGIDNVLPSPPPAKSFTIDRTAPTITPNTVKIINGTSSGFTVEMIGFTTTRDVTRVTMTFTSSQSIDGGGTFTVDVSAAFNAYFASAAGLANGGTFKLDLPFTISGADANVITAVSVTITNSAGTSTAVSGGR